MEDAREVTTEWPFSDPPNVAVITMRSIVDHGAWIAIVSRDADDGCWQFLDDAPDVRCEKDVMIVSLRSMVLADPSLSELADLPEGWQAWRDSPTDRWQRKAGTTA